MQIKLIAILIFSSFSSWAVDITSTNLIDEYNLVKTDVSRRGDDWEINSVQIDRDEFKYKGQNRNLIDWDNIDPNEWFDLNMWMKNRKIKDSDISWRQKYRENNYYEQIGKVIKCQGICYLYRGLEKNSIEYNSKIFEGDEVITEENSALWVVLVDGTLVRLSANTSMNMLEVNITDEEVFILSRLNQGNIHYESRSKLSTEEKNKPETDLSFMPLTLARANREFYMRKEYQALDDSEKLQYEIVLNPGYSSQYRELNKIIVENNKIFEKKKSRFYLYTPNLSFEGERASLDIFYETNRNTYFLYKDINAENEKSETNLVVSFRGHKNEQTMVPSENQWYSSDRRGREALEFYTEKIISPLEAMSNFTLRIPTIKLAREIIIAKDFQKLYEKHEGKFFAENLGYRLWNKEVSDELTKRKKFIKEYTRRVETTNLNAMEKVFKIPEDESISLDYYKKSMSLHYLKLKEMYQNESKKVRMMNDSEFYIWLLKNGK